MLLEIQVLGLHYLCPAVVNHVRAEPNLFGFRYDTLEGHIERGVEWFPLTKNARGEIRFRVEARWQKGPFPNWWSRVGFIVLSGYYQRKWHRRAHHRLSLLAHHGSTERPRRDAAGLTRQGIDVKFTYHTKRRWFPASRGEPPYCPGRCARPSRSPPVLDTPRGQAVTRGPCGRGGHLPV